ncbi:MAG: winged helix-turn-helix domain-containing protein [Bryobacteraceae bacterium]
MRDTEAVELPWRQFEALRLLIEAEGKPVEREMLLEALWPGVTVEEASLTQCISQLRKTLNDGPETGLIQTVPRRGYRLGLPPKALEVTVPEPERDKQEVGEGRSKKRWAVVVVCVAVLAGGGWTARRMVRRARAEDLAREGLALVRVNKPQPVAEGNELLRRALDLSPSLAIAYAGLAEGMVRSAQSRPGQARAMAMKALEADPECGPCLATAGWVLMSREWQWKEAMGYLSRAVKITPEDARIHIWHAQILAVNGKLPEALREAEQAVSMQPGEVAPVTMRSAVLYLQGRYDEAILGVRQALALQPTNSSALNWLYRAYGMQGHYAEALAALSSSRRHFTGTSPDTEYERTGHWQELLHNRGIGEWVKRQLDEEKVQPIKDMMRYEHATWRMWIGDRQGALEELEGLFSVRPYDSMYVGVDPAFRDLHKEARFQKILQRMGLQ